jgi:hypothetical protein
MFLQVLEQLQAAKGEETSEIHIPMDRSDIADYVGIITEQLMHFAR